MLNRIAAAQNYTTKEGFSMRSVAFKALAVGLASLMLMFSGSISTVWAGPTHSVPGQSGPSGGVQFPTPFIISITGLLIDKVTDCATGAVIPPEKLTAEFVFREGAHPPFQLSQLEKIIIKAEGYQPKEITSFMTMQFQLGPFGLIFIIPLERTICLPPLAWATDPLTVNPPTGHPGDNCLCLQVTVSVSNPHITWAKIERVDIRPPDGITIISWQQQAPVRDGKLVFTVCIKISENASPGERTVVVDYTGYEVTPGTVNTVTSIPDQHARGRFEVSGSRRVDNTGCGVIEPPSGPNNPPEEPGPPPPCGCRILWWPLTRLSYQPGLGTIIELGLWTFGRGMITIEPKPSDRALIIKKPDGTEMKALALPGETASPPGKHVIPCGNPIAVRLSVLLLGLTPPDNPEANLIRSFLDQLPKDWQVAPGQYLANVVVGAVFNIEVEDDCQPPNIVNFTVAPDFLIGPFRLIRNEKGELVLVVDSVDGRLQIQLLPPKRTALAAPYERSLARRLKAKLT
jgi:hypothetical protein